MGLRNPLHRIVPLEPQMTTILQINSAARAAGQSTQLATELSQKLLAKNPGSQLIVRDLLAQPLPHLDDALLGSFFTPDAQRDEKQRELVAASDILIAEIKAADIVVIGAPLYNFGISTQLKAYFDHIARAGETFAYGPAGPDGFLKGKTAYVALTRGGLYQGTPADIQTAHVTTFLNFLGIADIRLVFAEGLAMGEESARAGVQRAQRQIESMSA